MCGYDNGMNSDNDAMCSHDNIMCSYDQGIHSYNKFNECTIFHFSASKKIKNSSLTIGQNRIQGVFALHKNSTKLGLYEVFIPFL